MSGASGEWDRWVTLQQLTSGKEPSGYPKEDWSTLIELYAGRKDSGGRERFIASQTSAPFDTVWEIPYLPSMDPEVVNVPKTRRLIQDGRVYDIVAARQVGYRVAITLETLSGGTYAGPS